MCWKMVRRGPKRELRRKRKSTFTQMQKPRFPVALTGLVGAEGEHGGVVVEKRDLAELEDGEVVDEAEHQHREEQSISTEKSRATSRSTEQACCWKGLPAALLKTKSRMS